MSFEGQETVAMLVKYMIGMAVVILAFIRLLRIRRKRFAEASKLMSLSIRPEDRHLESNDIDIEFLAPALVSCMRSNASIGTETFPPNDSGVDQIFPMIVEGDIEATWKVTYEEETGTC